MTRAMPEISAVRVRSAERIERMKALVDVVSELSAMDEPRKRIAGLISGLDIRYDLGEGHPLLGRRMPDLDLTTAGSITLRIQAPHGAEPLVAGLLGQSG